MSGYELSELGRQMANLVRVGKVVELDEANARVKVSTAGLTTDWLPWGAGRAGKTRQWSPPQVGEQVILASPYGDLGQAAVIGSMFSDDNPAPATSKNQETTVFPDGSTVDYNSATNTLTLTVSGAGNVVVNCQVATVKAATSVTLDTPLTHCTGAVTVDGVLTYKGGLVGSGGATTATITGDVAVTGNITAGGTVSDGDGVDTA